jgi:hypothetical protein
MMSGNVSAVVMIANAERKNFSRGAHFLKQVDRRVKGSRTSRYAVVGEVPIGISGYGSPSERGEAIFHS